VTDQQVSATDNGNGDGGGRRGDIGRQTYQRVRDLLDDGVSRSVAFAQVGEETGRKPGTVATAFYRIAREQPDGGGVRQRPRKSRTAAASRSTRGQSRRAARQTAPSIDRLVADAHRSIDAVAAHLSQLDSEVRELREQSSATTASERWSRASCTGTFTRPPAATPLGGSTRSSRRPTRACGW
jgi:hypothetical protein